MPRRLCCGVRRRSFDLGGIRIGSAVYPGGVVSSGETVYLGGVRNGATVSL
jgi:hypothetical protein